MPQGLLAYQNLTNLEDLWRPVVLTVLNVISHKGIPSGETSFQMELLINATFFPSHKQAEYIIMIIWNQTMFGLFCRRYLAGY